MSDIIDLLIVVLIALVIGMIVPMLLNSLDVCGTNNEQISTVQYYNYSLQYQEDMRNSLDRIEYYISQ